MKQNNDISSSIQTSLSSFTQGLNQLEVAIHDQALANTIAQAVELIHQTQGRLIISGVGKSGHIGRKLAATFSSTGTPAYFVHPAEASHGDLGVIQNDDVLMLLSWAGETRELMDIVAYTIRFGVPMILITGRAKSTLASKARFSIVLPDVKEACPHNLAPTTSSLLQLAMGDSMAVALLRKRGFSEESFRNFHPGGKLGAALMPLRDSMFKTDRLPLVPLGASVIEVISEISAKGFGIVGVLDTENILAGVITDGDIRRYLESNTNAMLDDVLKQTTAQVLMTRNSVTMHPDNLSARALNVMQTHKISAAFVVQDALPVGLVTVLQLLQIGVA